MRRSTLLATTCSLALLGASTPALAPAATERTAYCGQLLVRIGPGDRDHVEIEVVSGSVSCRTARSVIRYAFAHRRAVHGANLSAPRGWTCRAARDRHPVVAGECLRHGPRARVRAYDRDNGD